MLRKITAAILAATLFIGALAGCSASTGSSDDIIIDDELLEAMKQYETLDAVSPNADGKFSLNYYPEYSFNPLTCTSTSNLMVASLMYDTMFELSPEFECSSRVVTEYTTEDNKMWCFYIDNGITFHDGSQLLAEDVAYSVMRAMQNDQYRGRLSCVYGISAMDEKLVMISLNYPNSQFPSLLNIPIIKKGSYSENVPLGTGPYMMDESGEKLVAYSGYSDASKMPVSEVYLKAYDSIEDYITAFENSDIDLVVNDPTGITNLGFSGMNESRSYNTTSMHYLGFNMNSTFMRYIANRGAVSYAIDRDYIAENVMSGNAAPAYLPISPASALYNESIFKNYYYDLDTCARIYENLGVRDYDADGLREYIVAGDTLEVYIKFIVCSDNVAKVAAAQKIANDMRAVGIPVTIVMLGWSDYIEALEEGEFDMYYGEIKLTSDFNLLSMLSVKGDLNYGNITDENYANLIYNYLGASDEDRQMHCDIMSAYILENCPITPICFEKSLVLTHRNSISGMSPTQYNVFYNLTDWTINLG